MGHFSSTFNLKANQLALAGSVSFHSYHGAIRERTGPTSSMPGMADYVNSDAVQGQRSTNNKVLVRIRLCMLRVYVFEGRC